MAKTPRTITIENSVWDKVKEHAENENRPISNFIETVLLKYFKELSDNKQEDNDT